MKTRRTLTLVVLAIGSLSSPAATVTLSGVLISTEALAEGAPQTGAFPLRLSGDFFDHCTAKNEIITLAFPTLSESLTLPNSHPLRHPKPNVITAPISCWPDGGIYIHQVVRYILGSETEAAAARQLLEASDFGSTGRHYLLVSDCKAVADGKVFSKTKDAVKYLMNNHVDSVLYLTHETSFPTEIPDDLMHSGISLYILDGHK